MFKFKKTQITELCRFAYMADAEARTDLAIGCIRDEDDYTSNFTGALRRNINTYGVSGLKATSFMLGTADERSIGCDAAIVIASEGAAKVVLFEAKLPRFARPATRWDYEQTATGGSHFSDQLQRQAKRTAQFAIFEMFYCDFPPRRQPPFMDDRASSCVWHSAAVTFDSGRPTPTDPWSTKELTQLLRTSHCTIDEVLEDVCTCKAGIQVSSTNYRVLLGEFGFVGPVLMVIAGDDTELLHQLEVAPK